jgi:hypothetical protein
MKLKSINNQAYKQITCLMVTLVIAGCSSQITTSPPATDPPVATDPSVRQIAKVEEKAGVMPVGDYVRMREIEATDSKTGVVSDADFDFLEAILDNHARTDAQTEQYVDSIMLHDIPSMSAARRTRVFHSAIPWLSRQSVPGDAFARYDAALLLVKLGNPQAVPYLIPLLHDPNPKLRAAAPKILAKLGYTRTG